MSRACWIALCLLAACSRGHWLRAGAVADREPGRRDLAAGDRAPPSDSRRDLAGLDLKPGLDAKPDTRKPDAKLVVDLKPKPDLPKKPEAGPDKGTSSCAHSPCVTGGFLAMGCHPCVDDVCNVDLYCCYPLGGQWDASCVNAYNCPCP